MLPTSLILVLSSFLSTLQAKESFLSENLIRKDQVQAVLEHRPNTARICNSNPTGPIETTLCDYESIESVNADLFRHLDSLVKLPFFKYFQVDLYRECPFWVDNGACMNRDCGVTTVDESEIPEKWRAASLSKLELGSQDVRHTLPGCYYRDSDFCFLEDNTEGEYVDLSLVPEQYTGYTGEKAHRVWKAIYDENCFGVSEQSASPPSALFSSVGQDDVQCLEKRVYYKIISGLHASISTHICHDDMNQQTGLRCRNLSCFVNRVASHPERLQYIYFNTILLLRAVARIGPYLSAYDYCSTGTSADDAETLESLGKVIKIANDVGRFDETSLFRGQDATTLKEEFKSHFRNVTQIMDCVACDKCRLWGKVQTTGLGTALKILFELDEKALDPHRNSNLLQRSEVVALLNTLHRFSESLEHYADFRHMWASMPSNEAQSLARSTDQTKSSNQPRPSSTIERSKGSSIYLLDKTRVRFLGWMELCRSGTFSCVRLILRTCSRAMQTFNSVLWPSHTAFRGIYEEL